MLRISSLTLPRYLRGRHLSKSVLAISLSSASTSPTVPSEANVVVIGGGIIGTSVAYHLGKLGVPDIVLLERDKLTSGTTWHAAGLINTFGSLSATSTTMRRYTKELYSTILPEETGLSCGFMPIGFIELACDKDRLEYYRRVAAFNRFCGVKVTEISAEEVKERCPIIETNDVLAGFYVEDDGRANPTDATQAFAKASRNLGVQIIEGAGVLDVRTTKTRGDVLPRVSSVTTACGESIKANSVVNCGGMWARQLGEKSGVVIPNQAAEHYYLITESFKEVDPSWPVVEDSSKCVYIRPEGGGLMLGLFETMGASWNETGIPDSFSFGEINADFDRMMPYLEEAMLRAPITLEVGAKHFFCGPESFTPDGSPSVGESAEVKNYYVAAGLNSIGILTGGGIGKVLAEWIRDGCAPSDVDVTAIDASRFQNYQNNRQYRADRVGEALGNTYATHYPDKPVKTCRGARRSAIHERLVGRNAYFRDVSGWESPSWYCPEGPAVVERQSFGRASWFPHWEAEHLACRNSVALFDMTFMSKFAVMGRDAGKLLNRMSTANVDGDCGLITYTQWLNERGHMEADLTVTKLSDEYFLVIATDTQHSQVLTKMRRQLSEDSNVSILDVTGTYCQINVQGPKSRELLQRVTTCDLADDTFPFRTAAEIDIGYARVLCARITYVGELGYELFIPSENALHVYDMIVQAGADLDLKHAGLRALGSLRLEKGYRDYHVDMDNTDRLVDVGLSFTCDFEKDGGFIGLEAVLEHKDIAKAEGGLKKRISQVLLQNPQPMLHHGEVLWRNGERVSEIRSASYGHTLGGAVGLTLLESNEPIKKSFIEEGDWCVEIGNELYPCSVSLRPLYDPKNERIKM